MENTFELFPKISKSFRRLPKIFQNFHKSFFIKVPQNNGFVAFAKFSEVPVNFPKIWAWDKLVMQFFLVGHSGICHLSLVFSQVTRGIFHAIIWLTDFACCDWSIPGP